ncbi:restriction endonuclease subunit S [Aliarcobacter cryaerophilus]|uniref:restriction endonuclease subunit S n=1 Tax=Aliarcobacter cryaerophilus TaxID=28198 RepID=UPI0021B31E4A|nr:restriction endonuclease subunit S [Aliarcobacter cryaerophilus]MCT7527452.1 restriction endonuclease subunit S [Aliarcobacter cryaerophilus]
MDILYKIPDSWIWTTLNELFLIERGGSPRPIQQFLTDEADGINWIKIGDTELGQKYIETTKEKIKPEGLKKSRLVVDGDFILSNSMSFGRPYIVKTTGAIHDGWLVFRDVDNNLDKDFFYYLLSSSYVYQQFSRNASGSTVRNLNIDIVKQTNISLPPLNEQKRIVAKIEKLFSNLDNSDKYLLHLEKQLKRYRQSVLKSAFKGELTKEWRQENKIKKSIYFKFISEIANTTSGGTPSRTKKEYWNGNINWLKSGELRDNYIELVEEKISDEGLKKSSAKIFPSGTLLMAMYGATVGRLGILNVDTSTNQAVCAIKNTYNAFITRYLFFYLMSIRQKMIEESFGGAQPNLSQGYINNIKVPICSILEQKEIVNQIEKHFSIIDKLENVVQKSINESKRLRKSILKQAFEGKLVEQDPNDESASILLEKIAKTKEEYQKAQKKQARKK